MDIVVERCGFLDVHRDTVVACVRVPDGVGGRNESVRTFGTTTAQLAELREWLVDAGVTLVGMEATGVYWKPVYYILEEAVETWLVNARHMRNLPGRKTDVRDAQWGCQLIEHGLIRPSFVPPPPIRQLRDLTRYRKSVTEERAREVQRLHKVLEDAGLKLASFTSRVLTKSGRDMLDALVAGERDPEVLANMARGRMRPKIPQLQEALAGRFSEHHALLVRSMLSRIDQANEVIDELDSQIEEVIAPFVAQRTLLMSVPGIQRNIAEVIIAEIGVDMSRFPTAGHLASWAGMCPGNNATAGKNKSGKTRPGNTWLQRALVEAAHAAGRSRDTYLSAQYHRIRGKHGPAKAAVAVGHSILVSVFHMLTTGELYRDLGGDYFTDAKAKDAHKRRLVKQLEQLGYHVSITEPEAA